MANVMNLYWSIDVYWAWEFIDVSCWPIINIWMTAEDWA